MNISHNIKFSDMRKVNVLKILLLIFSVILVVFGCKKDSVSNGPDNPDEPVATDTPLAPIRIDSNFYTITGDTTLPKAEILMTLNSNNASMDTTSRILILDQRGSIRIEKASTPIIDNLQKWRINGHTRYTYFHGTTTPGILGSEQGYTEICDSNLNILSTVKLQSHDDIDMTVQDKLDAHEFILIGDNHYISLAYYVKEPNNIPDSLNPATGVKVLAPIIQEVDNGQVIFQWDGTKYPEFYSSSVENNDFSNANGYKDYMHLNSICVDSADNNLIVSFRNINQIIKIDRHTGNIIWRLGGKNSDFAQTSDQMFLRQHYARSIENGKTLILLDNGLSGTRPYSRVLEFQLNENDKTISQFKAYKIPDDFIQYAGSVKKEGDNYFIGGGMGTGKGSYALEVNYVTNQPVFRLNLKYYSYRVLKY
jgi:hypothetical protein